MTEVYEWVMRVCGVICGQTPSRSPELFGLQFPLCWRCTGVYATLLVALAAFVLLRPLTSARRFYASMTATFVAAGLMVLDVFGFQALWPNNISRALTGVALGFALGVWMYQCLAVLFASEA